MPRESTTLEVTAMITSVVTSERPTSVSAKPVEYMTPVSVFLYMRKMKSPMTSAAARPMSVSSSENSLTLSRKLDLKMSLKVMFCPPYIIPNGGRRRTLKTRPGAGPLFAAGRR